MEYRFKVAVVGPGYWGQKVITELVRHPYIADRGISIVESSDSLSDVCANDEITHVFVTTPVATHYDICKELIRAGKNVMCEKNFVPHTSQAENLVFQASYMGVQLMIDFIYTFNPEVLALRDQLLRKPLEYGEEIEIKMLQHGKYRDEGVISILGSHAFALLGTIADISNARIHSRLFDNGFADKAIRLGVSLPDGVRANIDVSLMHHEKVRTISTTGNAEVALDFPNGIHEMITRFLEGFDNSTLALQVAECLKKAKE